MTDVARRIKDILCVIILSENIELIMVKRRVVKENQIRRSSKFTLVVAF